MGYRKRISPYTPMLMVISICGVVLATAKEVASALGASPRVIVAVAISGGLLAVAATVVTYAQIRRSDEAAARSIERSIVGRLLTFLEDRRLLTDDTNYQCHYPDHLRLSAEAIRKETNSALQELSRDSKLRVVLTDIQKAARHFQQRV